MLEKDNRSNEANWRTYLFFMKEKEKIKEARQNKIDLREINLLLKSLPLEICQLETDPVTNQRGWRAPKDKIFRISGEFIIETEQSEHNMVQYPPRLSRDLLIKENKREYQIFLKEANEDENIALKFLTEDLFNYTFTPPKFFDGKWLNVTLELKPSLYIKADIEAWYDPKAYRRDIRDIAPESEMMTECSFLHSIGETVWIQEYAEPVLDKCKIELIDSTDEEKKLYIPKTLNKEHLCVIDAKSYEQNIYVSVKRRPGQKREKELKDFIEKNSSFNFFEPNLDAIIHGAFPIAYRKEIILLEKNKKT
jgi:hypothetical protein